MPVRERIEQNEALLLSVYATKSSCSEGRKESESKCSVRSEFQRDKDRILHAKSFRRLMHKTQVFIAPENDHYRTRMTHTLEVSQIARTIARALRLNEDLTEAIALGHDLGHTPFGHAGEEALHQLLPGGFFHNQQSLRVVETIENQGRGLNLTAEVLDGILNHKMSGHPKTLEGKIVQIADKIAYVNHDINDAIDAGLLRQSDLPSDCLETLGFSSVERINFLVNNIVTVSYDSPDIKMEANTKRLFDKLRAYLFENLYDNKDEAKVSMMISSLYHHYKNNPSLLPGEFVNRVDQNGNPLERVVGDFIACMTDRYAKKCYEAIFYA